MKSGLAPHAFPPIKSKSCRISTRKNTKEYALARTYEMEVGIDSPDREIWTGILVEIGAVYISGNLSGT